MNIKGRAATDAAKRVVVDRVFAAWCKSPTERFGQFISNVLALTPGTEDPFVPEDDEIAARCEAYARGDRTNKDER